MPISRRPFYWSGVRGSQFVDGSQWFYQPDIEHELWGELVPEPFNPSDSQAVAIDVDGIRAGYLSRTAASYIHRHVSTLVATGSRVLIPIRFQIAKNSIDGGLHIDASAATPTFKTFDRILPSREEYEGILQPLWQQLPHAAIAMIISDGFHLTDETLAEIVTLRHLAPHSGLTSNTHLGSVPRGVELFLETMRRNHQRDLKLASRAAKEELHFRQVQRVAKLRRSGHTYKQISEIEGIGADTASKRFKESGIKLASDVKQVKEPATRRSRGRLATAPSSSESSSPRPARRPLNNSTKKTLRMLHANGWSATRLAEDHRRDLTEIQDILQEGD